jgi:hypothetical protein
MSFINSNELLINMKEKDVPRWNPKKHFYEQDKSTLDFYLEEKKKITEGLTIGGYYIHPWLYWHLNFFKTPVPIPDGNGSTKEVIMNPPLDDNFLFLIENYQEAQKQNKGLTIFGTRGYAKSTSLSSLITWLNSTKANGTTSIIGGSEQDLKAISKLVQTGFNKVNPAMFIPQLISDWDSNIELGLKEKDGFRLPYSHVSITNANKGTSKSSEKGAGLSPVGFIIDEALHEDSLIYTKQGKKPIKDIEIGEEIYGADGKLTKVLSKINPGVVDTWKITLSDGRSVICSDNHKWYVYNTIKNEYSVKTLSEFRDKYFYTKKDTRYNKSIKSYIYSLPINSAIEYNKKDVLIDPYYLGLYLGDGFTGKPVICSLDDDIIDYCVSYAEQLNMDYSIKSLDRVKGGDFRIINIKNKKRNQSNCITEALRFYNIDNIKSIPDIYLESSYEDRLALLQGIMDTDGSCSKKGTIEFSTSIKELSDSFSRLCRGLGIAFKIQLKKTNYIKNGKKVECKLCYRFKIYTDLKVFKLKRKLDNYNITDNKKQKAYKERVTISNIEYVGKNQVYCIGVDNANKLFITEDHIVTHNCGKFEFKKILQSALPSFITPHGAKLVPLLSGTSGNKELSQDAKDVLYDPEAFSMITMDWDKLERNVDPEYITWERSKKEKFGTFVPGQMSYRIPVPKIRTTLANHLGIKNKDIDKIRINVTNWKEATKHIQEKNASFKKIEDRDKNRMYYPLETDDVFITDSNNPFPTSVIDAHIRKLEDTGRIGKCVELYKQNGLLKQEFSPKKPAGREYTGGEVDAPILVFDEVPQTPPEKFKFVSGLDDYKLEQSDTVSLGAFYVIKRRNLEPNTPCETIVASYVGRPFRHADFHKTGETLIESWNAICMMEAVDVSFKQYLDFKNRSEQLLAPSISFSNSVQNGTTKLNSKFGIYPTAGNKSYMFNMLVDYCKEEHVLGIDDDGNQIIKYGVEFIEDIGLLREMLDWKKGGNFDRITAFMHALAYARELDKLEVRPREPKKAPTPQQLEKRKYLKMNAYPMMRGRKY